MVLEELDSQRREKPTQTLTLTPYTTVNSRLIIELSLKMQSYNTLKENLGENLQSVDLGNNFYTWYPKHDPQKEKKWKYWT